MMDDKSSEIVTFINGKNIFLTGATGFVGKLLLDQLLRKCNPNKLYLLIRPKYNVTPAQRLNEIFNHMLYDRLKNEKPNYLDKVQLISGDLSVENLGLSEESKLELIENVDLVIHGAATVKFEEPFITACKINVIGTIAICKLCHQIKNLKAFVHVSTAYCNCPYKDINEEFYEPPISCDKLLNMIDTLDEEQIEILSKKILGKWPNTYVFTKAVGEDVIRTHSQGLPVSIFRPAMIVPTRNEPIQGWIDNKYGPVGYSIAIGYGVLRVAPSDPNYPVDLVPGDMVASGIIAALYETSKQKVSNDVKIYNYTADKENQLTWGAYGDEAMKAFSEMPSENLLWPPSVIYSQNKTIIKILQFFLHLLPSILIDIGLVIMNEKPRAYNLYKKTRCYYETFIYFGLNSWNFSNNNVRKLWNSLNETDQRLFYFDMESLNWKCYIFNSVRESRFHLLKETPDSIPRALKKYRGKLFIQNIILSVMFIGLAALLSKILVTVF
ncbi:hypothetical protein O3M35_008394 [Rhynocoris fuscipes]|uniref:Fatty acyl-CoA reductase n=1 Tax=Rhynocoris fuscipes TaxID=488301 RepID=A0AAW1DBT8_9HEMI